MQLIHNGQRFVFVCSYHERQIAKDAGFRWDPGAKQWHTTDIMKAQKLRQYAAPACAQMLGEIQQHRRASLEASFATDSSIEIPVPDGLALRPFQRASVAFALNRRHTLVSDEMGLGKTPIAVTFANCIKPKSVLVVCPASLKINWKREWERWSTLGLTCEIAKGDYLPTSNVVIINYDILARHSDALREVEWDLVVYDEIHMTGNPKTKRTRSILGDKREGLWPLVGKRTLGLTGTPIRNRPIEIWPALHLLDENAWPSRHIFGLRYAGAHHNGRGWDYSGASNLGELQSLLRSTLMVRHLKSEVLTELPPKQRQIIELPANGLSEIIRQEAEIEQKHENLLIELRAAVEASVASDDPADYERAVAALAEAQRIAWTDIAAARRDTAIAKIPYVITHARELLESERKLVIFAHHKAVVDQLIEGLSEFGVVKLTGDSSMTQRQAAVDAFQTDPKVRVFVGNLQAAGVGITLTAASTVVFAELDWTPSNLSQGEDRCHRLGQHDSVLVQHLVLEGSIDAKMAKTVIAKQEVIDRALDKTIPTEPVLPEILAVPRETTTQRRLELGEIASKMTETQRMAIHASLRAIANYCDGARQLDSAGFSKLDVALGHSLAHTERLSPKQAALGLSLVRKYRRQVDAALLEQAGIQ